ncbi:unnamed protein product [Wuchereria bancrofti]|uniref:BTB domain-containing protein n=1 Tax=Wuchereria bancrofti TaxID=6293 RepID=A0A3P7DHU4_WUCBA|nr:unnamed protein product [Wuchereria bancrofti]
MSFRFILDARINIPTQMLHQEECRVPFIVAHGPRSIEFELRMQISGLITIRFGASKDTDNTVAAETVLNETQETDFENTFIMRGIDSFLESLHNTIMSAEYGNGLISFSILIIYQEAEFMQFVEQKSRLRLLTYAELQNSRLNSKAYKDFIVFGINTYSIMCSKWMLYMSTKYFHRLIDENPAVNHRTLNYPYDVIGYEWKHTDLDDLVRILTLPKYWELEELKIAARSHSTGVRYAVYRDLILCGTLDEICKPVESELEKIKRMGWKMSMVKKRVGLVEESSQNKAEIVAH